MASAHTTGPWSVEGPDCFGDYNIHCPHERAVVAAVISNVRPKEEVAASARLIAAGPVLLEALKSARETLLDLAKDVGGAAWLTDPYHADNGPIARINAAIAKAEGR